MSGLIQWPRAQYWDKAWNPIIGCKPISPACENCYAKAWAERFGQSFEPHGSTRKRPPRRGIVFCGNMTDLFGEWRICGEMAKNIAACISNYGACYLWLTKRVRRMIAAMQYVADHLRDPDMWSYNHYFGFTAENQQYYSERLLPVYRAKEKWMQFWVSAEPLLGPLRLGLDGDLIPGTFQWLVVGCESGQNRRPCKIEWVESIVDQCRSANVPVFVKQLDLNGKCERDITKFPEHLRIRQVPWAGGVA